MVDPTDVVRAHYAAIARRDLDAVPDTLAEDVAWDFPACPGIPFAGSRRGRREVAAFFESIRTSVEVREFVVHGMTVDGPLVIVRGRERFCVRATGRDWASEWIQVHTVRDGRITAFREYADTAAIAAAYA
ncbi:nuclear transport factor 2 family protein [Novispirillum sp. DQ9]|uniref:nuclear transport factor 2 family protein n=1 Tax=Novispirillum sp. DQ9 TaxID=3398612 RepID=UPI003C7CC10E